MKRIVTKLLFACLCGFAVTFFTGCELQINPAGGVNEMITGYVRCDDIPVAGIKVSSNYGYTITDEDGYFEILSYYLVDGANGTTISVPTENEKHELTFTDIDGDTNGKLKTHTEYVKAKSKSAITVIMEEDL